MPITPLPPVANVVKVTNTCKGNDGRLIENVLHFGYTGGPPSAADCVALATAFFNAWTSDLVPQMPATSSLVSSTVLDLSSETGNEGTVDNGGTPIPGTKTGGVLPLHTCALVSKDIARRYRGGRPRSYLGVGVDADLTDDGDWSTAATGVFLNGYTAVVDAFNGAHSGSTTITAEVNVSYYGGAPTVEGKSVRRETPVVDSILAYSMDQKVATQRKRVRKVARRR